MFYLSFLLVDKTIGKKMKRTIYFLLIKRQEKLKYYFIKFS